MTLAWHWYFFGHPERIKTQYPTDPRERHRRRYQRMKARKLYRLIRAGREGAP